MYYSPYLDPYIIQYHANPAVDMYGRQFVYWPYEKTHSQLSYESHLNDPAPPPLKDYGKRPFVVNIDKTTKANRNFRTALWTGKYMQVTLMSIDVGADIGLEVHPTVDQFLRIEAGQGIVRMGNSQNNLSFNQRVSDDDAIMVPAGTWHNLINTGNKLLKLYTIYAPPEHPFGTVHQTKADAIAVPES